MCPRVFTAALFIIAKTWKQPQYPLTDEWIKKLWYICACVHTYTMEYYSAVKRNTSKSVLMSWMNLEPIIQSKGSQKEKDKYCILMHWSEKAMAPHFSTLAWKIPWMEEPGRLQPMGLLRVGHDWATSLSLFTFMHWRRKWQPTPVFLPGESQGQESLVGWCLWGHTESDTTEAT